MTNIKNPSISITLFSPERLLCWPRQSVSTKRASLWNTSWPLSTSSPVLHCTPTAEQLKQVTTLNIITSSALHTNNWTSEASDHPQHHHQFCITHQKLNNKWSNWLHSTSSPVLHRTPTTEQVVQLTTLNITSSASHTNNWTTSEATDYTSSAPHTNNWTTSEATDYISSAPHTNNWTSGTPGHPQNHHQFCTRHQQLNM